MIRTLEGMVTYEERVGDRSGPDVGRDQWQVAFQRVSGFGS